MDIYFKEEENSLCTLLLPAPVGPMNLKKRKKKKLSIVVLFGD